jgi:hypothetical protein
MVGNQPAQLVRSGKVFGRRVSSGLGGLGGLGGLD